MKSAMDEIFEYRFTRLDPIAGDHIDPPSLAIYETLLTRGPGDIALPGLASSWQVSADGASWRLHLRDGALFHSGDPCDARAVADALEHCRWGDGLSRQIWYWDPVDTVTVVDRLTLEFRPHYPCDRLPVLLWGAHTAICNQRRRSSAGSRYGVGAADGTGPYRLVSFSPEQVEAERAPTSRRSSVFSGRSPGVIRWRSAPREEERQAIVTLGDAQIVRSVSPEWVSEERDGWRYHEQLENGQYYLALSFDDPRAFSQLDFRRAVDAFIDREALVAVAFGGRGDGRRSPIPLGDEYADSYTPAVVPPMTAGEADAVLTQLGWQRGPDGVRAKGQQTLRIDCVAQDSDAFRRLARELSIQLSRGGIALEFRFLEPFEAFYRACEKRPASFISKWLWPDGMEAIMGFSRSTCDADSGGNWQGAHLPNVDAAFDRFLQAASRPEHDEASRSAQEVFMRELPYIPLCSARETYAVRGDVHGFRLIPRTLYPSYETIRWRWRDAPSRS
jgi:ABC-type transport system substrate-binding protein